MKLIAFTHINGETVSYLNISHIVSITPIGDVYKITLENNKITEGNIKDNPVLTKFIKQCLLTNLTLSSH